MGRGGQGAPGGHSGHGAPASRARLVRLYAVLAAVAVKAWRRRRRILHPVLRALAPDSSASWHTSRMTATVAPRRRARVQDQAHMRGAGGRRSTARPGYRVPTITSPALPYHVLPLPYPTPGKGSARAAKRVQDAAARAAGQAAARHRHPGGQLLPPAAPPGQRVRPCPPARFRHGQPAADRLHRT